MELRQLEHFLAVAAERNFTRAADVLHISQSGLSASVRSLETELGADLFTRTTRRVTLTAAGQALVPEAERTVASAESARGAVEAVSGLMGGRVAVGSESCPGVVHLAADLAAFSRAHPAIAMSLLIGGSEALVEQVARGQLDVAFTVVTGPAPAGVLVEPLGTEELVVLAHPGRQLPTGVTLTDLVALPLADFSPGAASRVLTHRAFAAVGEDHRVAWEVNDVHTLLDLIGEDLAVAVVPRSIARKRADSLVAHPIGQPMPTWTVAIVTNDRPSPAARALRAHTAARLGRTLD